MNKLEQTDSFAAKNSNGDLVTVFEWINLLKHEPINGAAQWIKGLKEYKTARGTHFTLLKDGTFQDVHTKAIYTRV